MVSLNSRLEHNKEEEGGIRSDEITASNRSCDFISEDNCISKGGTCSAIQNIFILCYVLLLDSWTSKIYAMPGIGCMPSIAYPP